MSCCDATMYCNELYVLAPQQGRHRLAHVVFHPMQWGGQPTATCGRVQYNVGAENEFRQTVSEYPLTPSSLPKLPIYVHANSSIGPTGYSRGEQGSNVGPTQTCNTSPDSARRFRLSARKKESRRRLNNYRKEVRKCLEEARPIRVRCETNERGEISGLKTQFEEAVKSVAYCILDLNARTFACHSRKNIAFVDAEARKQFEFYPYPLREGYTEKYLREHLKQTRNKWKSWWLTYGASSRPHDCPEDVWRTWIRYWKTPAAEEESLKGKERRSKSKTPSKTGRKRSSSTYDEEVKSSFPAHARCLMLVYAIHRSIPCGVLDAGEGCSHFGSMDECGRCSEKRWQRKGECASD